MKSLRQYTMGCFEHLGQLKRRISRFRLGRSRSQSRSGTRGITIVRPSVEVSASLLQVKKKQHFPFSNHTGRCCVRNRKLTHAFSPLQGAPYDFRKVTPDSHRSLLEREEEKPPTDQMNESRPQHSLTAKTPCPSTTDLPSPAADDEGSALMIGG